MIRFALGLALPYVGIAAFHAYDWNLQLSDPASWRGLYAPAVGFGAAIMAALFFAVMLNYVRPRRIFDRRSRTRAAPIVAGIVTSVLTIIVAIPVVVFWDQYAPDWLLLAACAPLPTMLVMRLCRRVVPGTCGRCGFDLRASLETGRCPECGTIIVPTARSSHLVAA